MEALPSALMNSEKHICKTGLYSCPWDLDFLSRYELKCSFRESLKGARENLRLVFGNLIVVSIDFSRIYSKLEVSMENTKPQRFDFLNVSQIFFVFFFFFFFLSSLALYYHSLHRESGSFDSVKWVNRKRVNEYSREKVVFSAKHQPHKLSNFI